MLIAGRKNQGSNNVTSKWSEYTFWIEYIDAYTIADARTKVRTTWQVNGPNRIGNIHFWIELYRCFTHLPDARTKVRTTWQVNGTNWIRNIYFWIERQVFIDCFTQLQMQEPRLNNMTSKWSEIYIWIEVQVVIDALHNHYKGLSK